MCIRQKLNPAVREKNTVSKRAMVMMETMPTSPIQVRIWEFGRGALCACLCFAPENAYAISAMAGLGQLV
jgi:hypothetical protein